MIPKPQMKIPKTPQQPVRVSPGVYRQPSGALSRPAGGVMPPQGVKPNPLKSQPVGNMRPVQIPGGPGGPPPRLGVQPGVSPNPTQGLPPAHEMTGEYINDESGYGTWGHKPGQPWSEGELRRRQGMGLPVPEGQAYPTGPTDGGFGGGVTTQPGPGTSMQTILDYINKMKMQPGGVGGTFQQPNMGGVGGISGQITPQG